MIFPYSILFDTSGNASHLWAWSALEETLKQRPPEDLKVCLQSCTPRRGIILGDGHEKTTSFFFFFYIYIRWVPIM